MKKKDIEDIKRLKLVTGASFEAARAKISSIAAQEVAIKEQLSSLVGERNSVAKNPIGSEDAAFAAGASVRWHRWIDQRRKTLNMELARLRAEKLAARKALHRSFGRNESLRLIASKMEQTLSKRD